MALVNVVNMVVLDNPTCFTNPFQFEITFECLQELEDDLEWKILYVGSAQDSTQDQILDEILVGPVPVGVNKFILQADAPDISRFASVAPDDVLGVTVVLVTCSYKEREFVRVGYYVNNEYHDPNAPAELPLSPSTTTNIDPNNPESTTAAPSVPTIPTPLPLEHVQRQILADKPRVTKFPISWGSEDTMTPVTASGMSVPTGSTLSSSPAEQQEHHHQQQQQQQQASSSVASEFHMGEESNLGVQAMAE